MNNKNVPITNNKVIDTYLTHYCEKTNNLDNFCINFTLFKKICFPAGVPFITLDLIIYLTAGKNKEVIDLCTNTLKLLYERVPPIYKDRNTLI